MLPCCCRCCFLATDRFIWGKILLFYCKCITLNVCLIYSDISLNMDQCYISVLLPYLQCIVVLLSQKRYFERIGRILSSSQTVNPIHKLSNGNRLHKQIMCVRCGDWTNFDADFVHFYKQKRLSGSPQRSLEWVVHAARNMGLLLWQDTVRWEVLEDLHLSWITSLHLVSYTARCFQ